MPKVLVVDDTHANLLAVEIILESCHVEIVKAASGADALKQSLAGGFALVLLDVFMPGMDGYETATLLRSSARTREIPIIFLTATHGEKQAIFKGYEAGAVDYIFKPVNPAILKSKVKVFAELFQLKEQEKLRVAKEEMERFDIERRQLLTAENTKLRSILDNLTVGVTLVDASTKRITYANDRFQEIFRLEQQTAGRTGENWCESHAYHADGKPYSSDEFVLSRTLGGLVVQGEETIYRAADGAPSTLMVSGTPLRNGAGQTTAALVSFLDLTERVAAEKAKEIAQKQLQRAYKMSALGEMAGGVAHEVNNPLSIIVGKARQLRELLDEGHTDPNVLTTFVQAIETTAQRLVKVVKGLRTISRKSDRDPFVPCPLVSIVEDTLAICAARFNYESIGLIVEPAPSTLVIECRAAEISQVLLNLISNALDATEQGTEKWVKVTFEESPDWVDLLVTNSGPEIPAAIREKILEPFFTTKPVGKGTGLGLSVAKCIAEDHGGSLSLHESSATHTCFVMRLPKKQQAGWQQAV